MTSVKPIITFFGATGGCAANTLALALKSGHTCVALARTPSKLRTLMTEGHGVSDETLNAQLTIVEGNIRDVAAVKRALVHSNRLVDLIVSGVGSAPKPQKSLSQPITLHDPTICESAMASVTEALRALETDLAAPDVPVPKPSMVAISTTGVSARRRDVPLLFVPFYHWALAVPHADKARMEEAVVRAAAPPADGGVLAGFTIVRPSLLREGEARGVAAVRAGWELPAGVPDDAAPGSEPAPGPAVGYTITKADVGNWIFKELVDREKAGKWAGKCVSLTY
ncbi:hypothetical protein BDY21DRAFT_380151 [Lineolata rhizophorae]|uniref:Uncharacterized protein n=1 Tax=Lineolata rhizophorae TaxID=578093 RepID=A0A6A6NXQ5_9PEZI|nr:hypothetical protein BDY21DRAFT_380151 [Lineolata rhizophorae]